MIYVCVCVCVSLIGFSILNGSLVFSSHNHTTRSSEKKIYRSLSEYHCDFLLLDKGLQRSIQLKGRNEISICRYSPLLPARSLIPFVLLINSSY